jgi:hypothetical protein
MVGEGPFAEMIRRQFKVFCNRYGLNQEQMELDKNLFRRVKNGQLPLF